MLAGLLLFALPATAGEFIIAKGDTIEIGDRANWARIFAKDDGSGYWFLVAGGGDYHVQSLSLDFELESGRVGLTGFDYLVDHAMTRCPDGTWLHIASANISSLDDSAYAFRYDEDWSLLSWNTLVEEDPNTAYNDAPALCTGDFDGSPFQSRDNLVNYFWEIDDDNEVVDLRTFEGLPAVGGSSMVQEDDGTIIFIRAWYQDHTLLIERYDEPSRYPDGELKLVEAWEPDVVDEDLTTYWPQSTIRVGDYWVVAHMARDAKLAWITDTGNVYLQVFNLDWSLVETFQVTDFSGGQGGMQPFLTYVDGTDQLAVIYDVNVQPTLTTLTIDTDRFGVEVTENTPPVADAGGDLAITLGDAANLDGSDSSDADGDTLTYDWSFSSVPDGSTLETSALGAEAAVSFVPDLPGSYVVVLTVDDGRESDDDTVVVTVSEDSADGGSEDGGSEDGGSEDGGSADGGTTADGGAADGGDDGDGGGGGTDTGEEDDKGGCGCTGAAAPASLALALLPLLGAARRRRR